MTPLHDKRFQGESTDYRAAHFNMRSTGTSGGNLSVTLNGGAYRIAPKPGS